MKILLVGYGRMGQLVGQLAGQYDCEVAGIVDPQSLPHELQRHVTDVAATVHVIRQSSRSQSISGLGLPTCICR